MATLIDRDKCQERIFRFADRLVDWGFPKEAEAVRAVAKGIKLEKTVEVVLCRECVSYRVFESCNGERRCAVFDDANELPFLTEPDDYCSYGERRTDGN